MTPPTPEERLQRLEHQCSAILFLSAANMFANAITVLIAVIAVLS